MELNKLRLSQIDTSDIADSDFAASTDVDTVSSNLDSFASYANSTFSTGEVTPEGPPPPSSIGGTNFGYMSGGASPAAVNTIDKFPFASDTNASDVGNLTAATSITSGQSSSTHGYRSGGTPNIDTIDKFSFNSDGDASDVGELSANRNALAGQQSSTNGYASGGFAPGASNIIDKFPFSSDTNATAIADLSQARYSCTGNSSDINGYSCGGNEPTIGDTIDKFSFSADENATDVGELSSTTGRTAAQSSDANGYIASLTPNYDRIDKFSFSSDVNGTDIASLALSQVVVNTGQSSTTNGYATGGYDIPLAARADHIQKFPFSSDSTAVDIANLTQSRSDGAGQQY